MNMKSHMKNWGFSEFLFVIYVVSSFLVLENQVDSYFLVSGLMILPGAIVFFSRNWKEASKYSLICSLVLPVTFAVLLFVIYAMTAVIQYETGKLVYRISASFDVVGNIWLKTLMMCLPGVAIGIGLRWAAPKIRSL